MAILIGIKKLNGEWENYVMTRSPRMPTGEVDVLGRTIPAFAYVEAYDGLPREDALRVANSLRGMPKARRRKAFLDCAEGLRLCMRGGTL